ncbi:MAG TPA: branched-chain amino acid aminotransferase [Acidimicrobiales bacterium]|nr:branched-chain amino acid aminotransferase [Acidimicrobiales bacterium]
MMTADAARREQILADPGFGRHLTDHMVTTRFSVTPSGGTGGAWSDLELEPLADLALSPAAMVLHYGQAIFEGLKAYRQPDGSVALFRVTDNAARFNRSAARMAMPALPVDTFVEACRTIVRADVDWVPTRSGQSLYLRPFMFATEANLGVRAAQELLFAVIASPVDTFFPGGVRPISVRTADTAVRAAPGGLGAAKCAANYSASLQTKVTATADGFDEVLWLDAIEHRYVEELSGMNAFVVRDGELVTPPLSDTILEGITRASIIELARSFDIPVHEEPIAADDWVADASAGRVTEAFACGTAAVIAPIGTLTTATGSATMGDGTPGPITLRLREALVAIQEGRADDAFGWTSPA